MRWYKSQACFVTDPKVGVAARKGGVPKYVILALFHILLSRSCEKNDPSFLSTATDEETFIMEVEEQTGLLPAYIRKGLVGLDAVNLIDLKKLQVSKWEEYQKDGTNKDRQQRHRDKQGVTDSNARNADVTARNARNGEPPLHNVKKRVDKKRIDKKEKELPSGSSKKPPKQKEMNLDDWETENTPLTIESLDRWMHDNDLDPNLVKEELANFRDRCYGKGYAYLDFRRMFQGWCRSTEYGRPGLKAFKFNQPKGNQHGKQTFNSVGQDIIDKRKQRASERQTDDNNNHDMPDAKEVRDNA